MATKTSTYMQGHTAASQARHGARTVQGTCAYMVDKLKPDMHILDVGCGPGSITIGLARLVPDGSVLGIDRVEETLARARAQPDAPKNLSFATGDAMALDFADNAFDVVHTSQVVGHMQDPVHVLKEFHRVLKPGGFLACREGDHDSAAVYPESEGLRLWRDMSLKIHRSIGCPDNCGRHLKAYALAAGFAPEKSRLGMSTIVYEGPTAFATAQTILDQLDEDQVMREKAFAAGADESMYQVMYDAWDAWRRDPACVYAAMCGELVAYK